jgi:hypothetical protein
MFLLRRISYLIFVASLALPVVASVGGNQQAAKVAAVKAGDMPRMAIGRASTSAKPTATST